MKRRVNLTIDGDVIRQARLVARQSHTSVSQLVEDLLSRIADPSARKPEDFVEKWAGNLALAPRAARDPRREHLWKKYGLTERANSD